MTRTLSLALLRSVGAVAIGLAGWCAVAAVFPPDDGVVGVVATGLPVGLAVGRVSRTPLPAALAGALLGASFGGSAVTVAIGAAAGANLAVTAFELLAGRRGPYAAKRS